jgi:hypothetical protein
VLHSPTVPIPAADLLTELVVTAGASLPKATTDLSTWAEVRLLELALDVGAAIEASRIAPDSDDRQRAARLERLAKAVRRHWRMYDRALWFPLETLAHRGDGSSSSVENERLHLLKVGLFSALTECGINPITLSITDFWNWSWKRSIRHAERALRDEASDARTVPLEVGLHVPAPASNGLDDLMVADAAADRSRQLSVLLTRAAPRERQLLALLCTDPTLTLEQAAARMGVKSSTARVWLHRVRRRAAS